MNKFAHPAHAAHHADERLRRFEGHMDTVATISVLVVALTLMAALLTPANLVPW